MNFLVAMLSHSRLNGQVLLTSVIVLAFGITSCNSSEEKKNEVSVDAGAVGFPIHQAVAEEFQKSNLMLRLALLQVALAVA